MKKGHLLIVDDETHLLSVLSFMFVNHAEKITVAETAPEALKVIDTQTIDCILCDINLPRMSGIDILRIVRDKGLQTSFIFFTAQSGQGSILEAAKLGATGFFYKPHFSGIEKAVKATLNNEVYEVDPDSEYGKILQSLKF